MVGRTDPGGLLAEAAAGVVYYQFDVGVYVFPEVYKIVRFIVHLDSYLDPECAGGIRHPLRAQAHYFSRFLASEARSSQTPRIR